MNTEPTVAVLTMCAGLYACGNQVDEREDPFTSSIGATADAPGFRPGTEGTAFQVGPNSGLKAGLVGVATRAGDWGAITLWKSGRMVALPNADAPALGKAPLVASGEAHNDYVKSYFVARGLPADQIDLVVATAEMGVSGPTDEIDGKSGALGAYTSVLSRSVEGVPVDGSFAWASFNADGESTKEATWWPEIPAAAIVAAKELGEAVQDGRIAAVLGGKADGRVVIRHSLGLDERFAAVACFQTSRPGFAEAPCVDMTGKAVRAE